MSVLVERDKPNLPAILTKLDFVAKFIKKFNILLSTKCIQGT